MWTAGDSNPAPPPCKGGALPNELAAHVFNLVAALPGKLWNELAALITFGRQLFAPIVANELAAHVTLGLSLFLRCHSEDELITRNLSKYTSFHGKSQ